LASEVWWKTIFRSGRSRSLLSRAPWTAVRVVLAPLRSLHEVIWGLLLINILGLDPLVAILAIAIPYSAIGGKVFSEILDETDRAPLDALLSSGAPPLTAFLYGLIPAAFPNLLSYAFYRFECGIRAAAVLGLIGAGGLGYQILLSMQTLNYEEMWTLMAALILLSGLSDLWSSTVRNRLYAVNEAQDRQAFIHWSIFGAAALTLFSIGYLSPDIGRLFSAATIQRADYLFNQSFPPSLGTISFRQMVSLSQRTIAISVLAMAGAGLLGTALSFLGAHDFALRIGDRNYQGLRKVVGRWVLMATRLAFLVGRAVPPPVWALLLLFVFFPGVLPAAIALGIYNWGVVGRLMAEAIENLDKRPLDALQAQGTPAAQIFLYAALPATLPMAVSYILYRWEVCIRATVIVGLVGAGGLGRLIKEQLSSFDYDGVAASLLYLIALTLFVDLVSALVRSSLRADNA
jgi:phosphonate transport system permease protein